MPVKVNLGCGGKWLSDWINIDWSWNARVRKHPILKLLVPFLQRSNLIDTTFEWPYDLILHDIRRKLPFEDEAVDFIYMSHVIEHMKKYEAMSSLRECYRILKNEGLVGLAPPDLQFFATKYIERDLNFYFKKFQYRLSNEDTFADRFLSIVYDGTDEEPKKIGERIKYLLFPNPYHMWLYDYESISTILRKAGFKDVTRCSPRNGLVPDLDKLESLFLENLYIEAQKAKTKPAV
jgi:SAM-dependent methyltransferase